LYFNFFVSWASLDSEIVETEFQNKPIIIIIIIITIIITAKTESHSKTDYFNIGKTLKVL